MKRHGGLYEQIISLENLRAADTIAQKGKSDQKGVIEHNKNREENILALRIALRDLTFRTSSYHVFTIREPKERQIFRLPYYPDRIVHHAIMRILEPIFMASFTADTYSCIKGKGIHGAASALKNALRDEVATQYYLKMDIRKFYPSIDHKILKQLLRRKFKDERLLWLLDEIIDSAPGLPIGNYLSQFLANFYLSGLDHWLKEVKMVQHYFRYADDMVILGSSKADLHCLRWEIQEYIWTRLKLQLKKNYRVAPVDDHGIDFVGYVFRHFYILMRKTIKQNFARMMAKRPNLASFASYNSWAVHCNSRHFLKALLDEHIRRLQYRSTAKPIQRRQNKDRKGNQPADRSNSIRHRTLELPRQREWKTAKIGIPVGNRRAHPFFKLHHHDGTNTKGTD